MPLTAHDLAARLATASRLAVWGVTAFALVVLAGWLTGVAWVTDFGVGSARTSVPTAIALLLSAFAVSRMGSADGGAGPLALLAAAIVAGIALFVLAGHVAGVAEAGAIGGAGLGRMSSATALAFVLLAGAIVADARIPPFASPLATLGLIVVGTALSGYLFGVEALYRVAFFSAMSLPTAIALAMLFLATILAHPRRGWIRFAARGGASGVAFRRLIPVVVLVPIVSTGLVALLEAARVIDAAFGFALLAVAMTATLALFVVTAAAGLERLETASERLAAIVESSDDAIIAKSPDGTIGSWNGGAERLFGYLAAEVVGRSIDLVVPERRRAEEAELLARVHRGERIASFETVRRCRDGRELPVSVTLSPVRDDDGTVIGVSSITRDIAELKRRDSELQRSNAELEQFAYVASHDLQEPLRMVANYTELLAERYRGQLDERADRYIGFASDGARRMQRLVADLLAYSRVGSQGKPFAPVDSGTVVTRVEQALGPLIAENDARIEHDALPAVLGDEGQIFQLFQNLIGNAVKFRSEAPPLVTISAERAGAFWRFTVADNGIGFDMAHAGRIFQLFQRLHGRGEFDGSGLGLAIVKRIVERHGGTIEADSAPGAGTRFRFTLPAAD